MILFIVLIPLVIFWKVVENNKQVESQRTYHIVCRDGDYLYEDTVTNFNYSHQNVICYTNSSNARMCRSFATCTWTRVR